MTTMIAELYEALVDAGASEGKAKEAARVLSTENLATKRDITELDTKLSPKVVKLDRDMAVMKWMLGTTMVGVASILAAVLSIVIKIFFLAW